MNQVISKLVKIAMDRAIDRGGIHISTMIPNSFSEVFAELIIKECLVLCNEAHAEGGPSDYGAYEAANKISERFGINHDRD